MRTTNFSKAPDYADAQSMFFGATRYKLRGLLVLPVKWFRLTRALHRAPGFLKLLVWYKFPSTIGSVVFFKDQESMTKFARSPQHKDVMIWVGDPREKTSDAGFIRFFDVSPHGYANGRWSTEDRMDHIKTFSRLPGETKDTPVDPPDTHK